MKEVEKEADNITSYLLGCLKDPMLLQRCVLDGLDEQIVGEDAARKTIFLCAVGSLVENSNHTSYNLMVNSESGAGKDHLVNNVLNILPQPKILKRTRISPTTLTYWHNSLFEPKWSWDGKILYLEDVSNQVLNCEVFKVFTSGGSFATIVKDQRAIDIKINGKPVVIITSASANPDPEMIRRFIVINLNESEDQTSEVMDKWVDYAEQGDVPKINNDYSKALEYLKPHRVKIPFAKQIRPHFKSKHIIMRTYMSRFLDFIKASTVLHQYSREKDSDEYIIAEGKDYDVAREIILATSTNNQCVPLTKNQREVLDLIKELKLCEQIEHSQSGQETLVKRGWTHSELCIQMPFSKSFIYREINKLVKMGFIKKETHRFPESTKPNAVYSYLKQDDLKLPTWEEITGGMKNELRK